jgi:23S rRNA pseudouridine2605 synthase
VTVNGAVAVLGTRAGTDDVIALDGRDVPLRPQAAVRVLIYHKPVGELVTRSDPQGRPTVFSRLPPGRWVAVGRLDINSSGLLLFTDSGELANRLMHPRYEIEREYAVRVQGRLRPEDLEKLRRGANRWYRVCLNEGRNREVRRMFDAVGARVSRLLRVRYGGVELPRDLAPGHWRELSPASVEKLFHDGNPVKLQKL